MLVQYLRKKNGQKRGVLVAIKTSVDTVSCGYSLCNLKLDRFDRKRGTEMAVGRAMKVGEMRRTRIPHSIVREYERFAYRAGKYYRCQVNVIKVDSTGAVEVQALS